VGLGEAEALYRALFDLKGWTPRQVDSCELWELAALLVRDEAQAPAGSNGSVGLTGKALLEARIKAHREGKPPPSFGPRPSILN